MHRVRAELQPARVSQAASAEAWVSTDGVDREIARNFEQTLMPCNAALLDRRRRAPVCMRHLPEKVCALVSGCV